MAFDSVQAQAGQKQGHGPEHHPQSGNDSREQYGGTMALLVRQRRYREDRQTRIDLLNPCTDGSHEGGLGSQGRTSGAQMDGCGHVLGLEWLIDEGLDFPIAPNAL